MKDYYPQRTLIPHKMSRIYDAFNNNINENQMKIC